MALSIDSLLSPVEPLKAPFDREGLEDIGYMTCMTLVLLGNYAQTGHFGGPLAYTPYNVAAHLAGPELGGMRYDYRRPKHPFGDKFMLAGGHNVPTGYALWMIMGQALERKYQSHRRQAILRRSQNRHAAHRRPRIPPRRGRAQDAARRIRGWPTIRCLPRPKLRGIKALAGHAESVDVTNDVNGGPRASASPPRPAKPRSGISSARPSSPKVIALEGEFAMTEGHAQELKTQALALQVGKRLRILLSENNAGIDDVLLGGVIAQQVPRLRPGRSVDFLRLERLHLDNGNDYAQIVSVLKTMEDWDPSDRRPMIVIGRTTKGYWPRAVDGKIPGHGDQLVSYQSHPYAMKMNSDYFVALAQTFEEHYGVEFAGIRKGPVTDPRERLIQFKTNIDVVMSLLDRNGLGDWLADRLVEIGDTVKDDVPLHFDAKTRSVPRRSPARGESARRAAERDGDESPVGRGEAGRHHALPQAGRNGRTAARQFRKSSSG